METAVAKREEMSIAECYTSEQIDLIKQTVCKGSTDPELKLFLYQAHRSGLDPLSRQIHAVKRQGAMTIQTGIDGYRLIADRTGKYAGNDDPVFDTEDKKNPGKATVTVYKLVAGQRCAFTATARWEEYCPKGTQAFMWGKMPYLMIGKCAEALALRKAFPAELSGLYTDEEMSQAEAKEPKSASIAAPPVVGPQVVPERVAEADQEAEVVVSDNEVSTTFTYESREYTTGGIGLDTFSKIIAHSRKSDTKKAKLVKMLKGRRLSELTEPEGLEILLAFAPKARAKAKAAEPIKEAATEPNSLTTEFEFEGRQFSTAGITFATFAKVVEASRLGDENKTMFATLLHGLKLSSLTESEGLSVLWALDPAQQTGAAEPAEKSEADQASMKKFYARLKKFGFEERIGDVKSYFYTARGVESLTQLDSSLWKSVHDELDIHLESMKSRAGFNTLLNSLKPQE